MAWHWHRVQQNHDVILAGTMQLKAFLDPQNKKIGEYCEIIDKVQPNLGRITYAAFLSASAFEAITVISSFQDFTKDFAPSSWS
jgi:hypothetical protein